MVTPRYFGWDVFSRSVLFHLTSNVLFASRFFPWNGVTWVLSGLALRPLDLYQVVRSCSASSMVCSTSVKVGYWAVTHRSSA